MKREERAVFALRALYQRYGYQPYKMSRFEEYDLYVRNKDFLVSEEVITFTDTNGKLLALKPDVTLSIIKNVQDQPGAVQKVFYNENVYRIAKGTHSFKEIMQTGLECVGDLGAYEIAEVVLLAAKSLQQISPHFMLDLSHMGLVGALLEEAGLSQQGCEEAARCLSEKNRHELQALCQKEQIAKKAAEKLVALLDYHSSAQEALKALSFRMETPAEQAAFDALAALLRILDQNGFREQVQLDFSVGNDMRYYSGVVFKGYIEGIPAAVLSGGQYDKLLEKMGRKSGAIGFAVYLDLLESAPEEDPAYDVDILVLHSGEEEAEALVREVECLPATQSVLVVKEKPKQLRWRRLMRLEEGRLKTIGTDD